MKLFITIFIGGIVLMLIAFFALILINSFIEWNFSFEVLDEVYDVMSYRNLRIALFFYIALVGIVTFLVTSFKNRI